MYRDFFIAAPRPWGTCRTATVLHFCAVYKFWDNVRCDVYVGQHNGVIPHAALRGLTPDEMYFGTAASEASEMPSRLAAARAARLLANRAVSCPVCPARPGSGGRPGVRRWGRVAGTRAKSYLMSLERARLRTGLVRARHSGPTLCQASVARTRATRYVMSLEPAGLPMRIDRAYSRRRASIGERRAAVLAGRTLAIPAARHILANANATVTRSNSG